MFVDEFLPAYDVSDAVATIVDANVATTWNALLEVDLLDVGRKRPLVGLLGALRAVPDVLNHLLHGDIPHSPARLRLRDTIALALGDGGWVLLGERDQDEIALGLVGKFWLPVITFARVTADRFRNFAEPGYAKTIYALSVKKLDEQRTLLTGVMRTATTDPSARKWFRRYWTFGIGSGAHVLVQGVIDVTREAAERQAAAEGPATMPIRIGQRPDHGFDEPLGLLSDCHRRIEHFLHVLSQLSEQAGGGPLTSSQQKDFEGALTYFATAAPRHTADEEESLFPRLRASDDASAHASLDVLEQLERDHAEADAHHRRVDELIRRWMADGQLPAHDVAELGQRLSALRAMYARHIAIEDHELFPAAGRALSAADLKEIGREMAGRRVSTLSRT